MGLKQKNKQLEAILKNIDPTKGNIYANGPGAYNTIPASPEDNPSPAYKREERCWK